MESMAPSAAELSGFVTIQDIINWAGMDPRVQPSFRMVVGDPNSTRILAAIPPAVFEIAIAGWHVPTPPPTEGMVTALGTTTKASPADQATAFLVFQAARAKMGMKFSLHDSDSRIDGTKAKAMAKPLIRKVKMNQIADQLIEQEIDAKSGPEMTALVDIHIRKTGAEPDPDNEATAEQMAALEAYLEADMPPSPDLAVFGPHGTATQRKLKFKGLVPQPDGSFTQQEISGPPNFEIWKACMLVLKVAFIMLEVVEPQRMDNYINHIGKLSRNYGKACWSIIYQADCEMRTNEFARIKGRLDRKHRRDSALRNALAVAGVVPDNNDYDPAQPWNIVYHHAVYGGEASEFWQSKVKDHCLMLLGRHVREEELVHDHGRHPTAGRLGDENVIGFDEPSWEPAGRGRGVTSPTAKAKARANRSRTPRGAAAGSDQSTQDDQGHYTTNRRGRELCRGYQSGSCTGNQNCPVNSTRVHQCHWCLKQHPGDVPGSCAFVPRGTTNTKGSKGGKGRQGKGKGF